MDMSARAFLFAILALVGGVTVIGGALAFLGLGGVPGSISGDGMMNPGDTPTTGDDDTVASIYFKAQDRLADSTTDLAGDYYVYNSDGVQVASGTTSTGSFEQVTDLQENSDYTVWFVDDDDADSDDVYSAKAEITTGEGVVRKVIEADRQGTLTADLREDDGTEDDGTISVNQGQTQTVTLELNEGSGDAVYNEPAVFVKTNDTSAISDITVDGTEIEVPDRISSYNDGYDLPFNQLVDFGGSTMESQEETVQVQITRDESNSDTAQVTLLVADGDEFQNDQDSWEFGYEDSSENDIRVGDTTKTVTVN